MPPDVIGANMISAKEEKLLMSLCVGETISIKFIHGTDWIKAVVCGWSRHSGPMMATIDSNGLWGGRFYKDEVVEAKSRRQQMELI
jgi:hypothetical protein